MYTRFMMGTRSCRWIKRNLSLILSFTGMVVYIGFLSSRSHLNEMEIPPVQDRVLIAILIRNKAHVLPWFFGHLENLNYPKEKMIIWIRSDHNTDASIDAIEAWRGAMRNVYLEIDVETNATKEFPYDNTWSKDRFDRVMSLRDKAFVVARRKGARYLFLLDADVILENGDTLNMLIAANRTIIAPMLRTAIASTYSNYWAGQTDRGYYKSVPRYYDILRRRQEGVFEVPLVHMAILIDLADDRTKHISYSTFLPGYHGPYDDIIMFAYSARIYGIPMNIINTGEFGTVLNPLSDDQTLADDAEQMTYAKIRAMDDYRPGLLRTPHIKIAEKTLDKLGFDEIFVINLKRRTKRRQRVVEAFRELGLDMTLVDGYDGRDLRVKETTESNRFTSYPDIMLRYDTNGHLNTSLYNKYDDFNFSITNFSFMCSNILPSPVYGSDAFLSRDMNSSFIKSRGIKMLPGYEDPYHKRPLTLGEVGCFLSHYKLWEKVKSQDLSRVLIFEDDVQFIPFFMRKLKKMMSEVNDRVKTWDFLYLGRKALRQNEEHVVDDSPFLVRPAYSYWTIGYAVTRGGVEKLLAPEPLGKMTAVDEYIPIMCDNHPNEEWKRHYHPRTLSCLSISPLLISPTFFAEDVNSDTEDSGLLVTLEGARNDTPSP